MTSTPAPRISQFAMARSMQLAEGLHSSMDLKKPEYPAGVGPAPGSAQRIAMDQQIEFAYGYANSIGWNYQFIGYPELSQLAQLPEYRMMVDALAKTATRKWIKVVSTGDNDLSAKIKIIEEQLKKHNVRKIFRTAAEHDGYFGRGQIYVNVGIGDTRDELVYKKETIPKGSLRGFKNVEPIWSYPNQYNSNQPLRDDFFVPQSWYVMADIVHKSRFLTMISRPVPDLLKPAYSFGGLSMSQIAQPYVNNWIRTRNSIGDLVHSFSLTYLKTNMQSVLQEQNDGATLFQRLAFFNQLKDNKGVAAIDFNMEEFGQINTPVTGMDDLQAQAQEQLCSVSHTPVIFLLGLTPTGLNTSTDGEIRAYYDYVNSVQEAIFTPALEVVLDIIQLDQFGEIDPGIGFEYVPLWQMDDEAQSRIRKSNADGDNIYLQAGVVSELEVRKKLAADPTSGYNGIEPEELPPKPDPAMELDPMQDNGEDDNDT